MNKKWKLILITIGILLVSITTVLLFVGEDKINLHNDDVKAQILHENEINEPQDESFYRDFLKNHEDEIIILDKDIKILFSSENWREELGYKEKDINEEEYFEFIHPKDLPFIAEMMMELLKNGKEIKGMGPFRLKDKTGQYRMYISNTIPLLNEDEEIVEIGNLLKDVTDPSQVDNEDYRKRLEEFADSIDEDDEGDGARYFYYYDDSDTYHYYYDPNNTTSGTSNSTDKKVEPKTSTTEKNPNKPNSEDTTNPDEQNNTEPQINENPKEPKDTKVQNEPGGTTNPPPEPAPNENKPVKEPNPKSKK